METKDRDKIRVAAEKATKGPWKQMTGKVVAAAYIVAECDFADARFIALTDPDTVIALLDSLDSAEKLWDIKEWPCQTHLRAKTMEKHLEQIQTMFGDKLDSPLQQQNRELILENSRLREALECMTALRTGSVFTSEGAKNQVIFEQMSDYINKFTPEDVIITIINWSGAETVATQALTPASSQVILDN